MARKRLVPGLNKLRRRLPGRRAPRPVVVVVEPEPVVAGLPPVARKEARVELPAQEPEFVAKLPTLARERAIVQLPVQGDYGPDVERLSEAVLALGDRVDQMARSER